ncbi:hypothetical protein SAY87_030201 [Trapa incisa]|uniref:Uncharacterized protein n=1 Tax=Trapa incisa TaxID=236973 RepID=A0AAN7QJM1_9MYRT|nr:hypothetical protein SAY87_030201 [Trapa incisa]
MVLFFYAQLMDLYQEWRKMVASGAGRSFCLSGGDPRHHRWQCFRTNKVEKKLGEFSTSDIDLLLIVSYIDHHPQAEVPQLTAGGRGDAGPSNLARLFQCFDWRPPDGMKQKDLNTTEVYGMTMPRASRFCSR